MRLAAGFLVVLPLLVSCGGSGDVPSATTTVTATVPAEVSPPASEPTPDTLAATVSIGGEQAIYWGNLTVERINPNVTSDLEVMRGLGDERWVGALVRACVDESFTDEQLKFSWGPWSLTDRAGGVGTSLVDTTGPKYPQPSYPQLGDRTTRPGTCVRGWVVLRTTAGAKVAEVVYEGQGIPAPLVWQVG